MATIAETLDKMRALDGDADAARRNNRRERDRQRAVLDGGGDQAQRREPEESARLQDQAHQQRTHQEQEHADAAATSQAATDFTGATGAADDTGGGRPVEEWKDDLTPTEPVQGDSPSPESAQESAQESAEAVGQLRDLLPDGFGDAGQGGAPDVTADAGQDGEPADTAPTLVDLLPVGLASSLDEDEPDFSQEKSRPGSTSPKTSVPGGSDGAGQRPPAGDARFTTRTPLPGPDPNRPFRSMVTDGNGRVGILDSAEAPEPAAPPAGRRGRRKPPGPREPDRYRQPAQGGGPTYAKPAPIYVVR